jgi:hypothetical protein
MAAFIRDVNGFKALGDPGAIELGSLLCTIAVGDDCEPMPAQVSETRENVGEQRPSRLVDAEVDLE